MISGMDTESMVAELMKAQNLKKTKVQNQITTTQWTQDKWKDLNSKIYSFYTGDLSKLRLQSSFNTIKASSSDESKVTITANNNASQGTNTLFIKQLAKSQTVTGDVLAADKNGKAVTTSTKLVDLGLTADPDNLIKVTVGGKEKSIEIEAGTTIAGLVQKFKDAGLNANYDATQKRFFLSSKNSGTENAFSLTSSGDVDLAALGLNDLSASNGVVTVSGSAHSVVIQPSDAKVMFNGAELVSSSNTMTVNGITMTLKGASAGANTADPSDDVVTNLNITRDTQAAYDMVKNFIKTYNDLLTEMTGDYEAPSAKGYSPLTDDQKESMTDTQIEQWETKIKNALLRRDNNLSAIMNSMRSSFNDSVTIDGKKYSLASLGIGSVNYTEKGVLHINGDADDKLTSGKTNDLMSMLTSDPDKVMKVMSGLADKLYTSLSDSMRSSSVRSAFTLYNDKELSKQLTGYQSNLKDLEKKLNDVENRYYKQFSAMESAMAKLNSQSSSLASLLGK